MPHLVVCTKFVCATACCARRRHCHVVHGGDLVIRGAVIALFCVVGNGNGNLTGRLAGSSTTGVPSIPGAWKKNLPTFYPAVKLCHRRVSHQGNTHLLRICANDPRLTISRFRAGSIFAFRSRKTAFREKAIPDDRKSAMVYSLQQIIGKRTRVSE